ncbi:hypothetical protein [Pseudarthrobacter sp. S9]|uniref:hypothetical protein n=1 Tax=Pseudarthrobacter sp. S9 TaxID=3418421 RepID=UPI003D054E32
MNAAEMTKTADSLAAVLAAVESGEQDLDTTRQGRAFLAGAEQALRAAAAA